MITGSHSIIYSSNPDKDRAFIRDVLQFPYVDIGDNWLIFALPPSELAVHPSDEDGIQEFYLLCDDIAAFVTQMKKHHVKCTKVQTLTWGMLTTLKLPGGGALKIYQPLHKRPHAIRLPAKTTKSRSKPKSRESGFEDCLSKRVFCKSVRAEHIEENLLTNRWSTPARIWLESAADVPVHNVPFAAGRVLNSMLSPSKIC